MSELDDLWKLFPPEQVMTLYINDKPVHRGPCRDLRAVLGVLVVNDLDRISVREDFDPGLPSEEGWDS